MTLLTYLLFIIAFAAITVGATVPQAIADDRAGTEQDRLAIERTFGFAALPKPATAIFRGVVASVDERSNTIRIRGSSQTTEEFKVQDGLLFNSVRYGDRVEITVEKIAGAKTIVGLTKE